MLFSTIGLLSLGLLTATVRAQEGPPELYYQVLYEPEECEQKTEHGDRLTINYTASKYHGGEILDSTEDEGREPWKYSLGYGHVILGVDRATKGMCVHQKRRIYIPAEFAYGKDGNPPGIGPDEPLIYDIHLLAIERGEQVWGTPAKEAPPIKVDLPLGDSDIDLNIPPIDFDPELLAAHISAASKRAQQTPEPIENTEQTNTNHDEL